VSTPGPVDPTPDDGAGAVDALASAKDALDAARETVAALVTVRAKAIQEAARLRARAAVPGHGELEEPAALHEARATALEERIDQMRDLARRAEVAFEALKADHSRAAELPPHDPPGSDGAAGTG
jgi:hypothetical protein